MIEKQSFTFLTASNTIGWKMEELSGWCENHLGFSENIETGCERCGHL